MKTLESTLDRRKVIITCGTGGVGKTTVSAALAMRAALEGKKVVVVTIDPAKRLGTSLGIQVGDEPTDITQQVAEAAGKDLGQGRLWAIIPDTQKTFEKFVRTIAPSEKVVERIQNNPIFDIMAKDFSGANEYMALQKLEALDREGDYDLIVLDTPPSRNTVDFIHAPRLLSRFFEEKLIRWIVLPANRLFSSSMRKAFGALERLTGAAFIKHLVDFAETLYEVQETFTSKLKRVTELLESDKVGFMLVSGPTPDTIPELRHLAKTLQEKHFYFDGLILNRTLGKIEADGESAGSTSEHPAAKVVDALQKREDNVIEDLLSTLEAYSGQGGIFRVRLPEFARDIHSIKDLYHVAQCMDDSF